MNVSLDNTRALGIGETVLPSDYWRTPIGDVLQPVEQPEVGKLINEDDAVEYRRLLSANPYEAIETEIGLETEAGKAALRVALDNIKLLDRKHLDYGPGNIAAFGEFGITVRLSDKIERLKNLIRSQTPRNESLEDTYADICNYAVIATLIRRNLWK